MLEEVTFDEGIADIDIESWPQLMDIFRKLGKHEWLGYRGHDSSDYELRSSLNRLNTQHIKAKTTSYIVTQHLKNFRSSIRGRSQIIDPYIVSDQELWAIGQHHGLATPLLDWTESAFVAAYFAFYKDPAVPASGGKRTVFALDTRALMHDFMRQIERRLPMYGDLFLDEINEIDSLVKSENGEPLYSETINYIFEGNVSCNERLMARCENIVYEALHDSFKLVHPKSGENKRLINQRGFFTFSYIDSSLEYHIKRRYSDQKYKVLLKLNIKNDLKEEILFSLEQMNIHHATLFPDLIGSAEYCNSMIKRYKSRGW